jgi:hypothetical protein
MYWHSCVRYLGWNSTIEGMDLQSGPRPPKDINAYLTKRFDLYLAWMEGRVPAFGAGLLFVNLLFIAFRGLISYTVWEIIAK